jgi:hypothetical protein
MPVELERELLNRECRHVAGCRWKCRRVHRRQRPTSVRSDQERLAAEVVWSTSSVWSMSSDRRFTAFARSAAASRAITASPTCATRGTLRSSASMSSRSLCATSLDVTATRQLRLGHHDVGRRSIPRRTVDSASSCWRLDASRSSSPTRTGMRDTPGRRSSRRSNPAGRGNSRALPSIALVRAGGRNGRLAQESERLPVYAAGSDCAGLSAPTSRACDAGASRVRPAVMPSCAV